MTLIAAVGGCEIEARVLKIHCPIAYGWWLSAVHNCVGGDKVLSTSQQGPCSVWDITHHKTLCLGQQILAKQFSNRLLFVLV